MIDVQSTMAKIMDCTRNSDTQEVDHEVIGSYPDVLSDARGTQLLSRGGKHLSELNLQGLDSSIVRLGTAKDDERDDWTFQCIPQTLRCANPNSWKWNI